MTRLAAEQRRTQVVAAARDLFGQHGYDQTSVERIAQAAGCTTGPVYHFFGTKKALFAAALRGCIRDAAASLAEVREQHAQTSALERLVASCDHLLGLLSDPEIATIALDAPRAIGHDDYTSLFTNSLLPFIETDLAVAMDNSEIQPEPTEPLAIIIAGAVIATANHLAHTPTASGSERAPHRAAIRHTLQRLQHAP